MKLFYFERSIRNKYEVDLERYESFYLNNMLVFILMFDWQFMNYCGTGSNHLSLPTAIIFPFASLVSSLGNDERLRHKAREERNRYIYVCVLL